MRGPEPPLAPLPARPLPEARRRAVGERAGQVFEGSHRQRIWFSHTMRVALTVLLTGAAALYLLWALQRARTFG